jgi:hypothetical protein
VVTAELAKQGLLTTTEITSKLEVAIKPLLEHKNTSYTWQESVKDEITKLR